MPAGSLCHHGAAASSSTRGRPARRWRPLPRGSDPPEQTRVQTLRCQGPIFATTSSTGRGRRLPAALRSRALPLQRASRRVSEILALQVLAFARPRGAPCSKVSAPRKRGPRSCPARGQAPRNPAVFWALSAHGIELPRRLARTRGRRSRSLLAGPIERTCPGLSFTIRTFWGQSRHVCCHFVVIPGDSFEQKFPLVHLSGAFGTFIK